MRKRPLSKAGLDAAVDRLRRYMRSVDRPDTYAVEVARDMLTAYEIAKKSEDVKGRNYAEKTWLVANMEVGQQLHFENTSLQLMRQRFPSARRIADNEKMKWRCESLDTGEIRVTRLPDNSPTLRDPLTNDKVRELVSMQVGELIASRTVTATRGAGYLGSNSKVMARRYLGVKDAQWIVFREQGIIMIRRTK